jgi:ribosomal protein L11 methyltransferase
LIRLAIRCRSQQAELVLAELAAMAPNGFEEEQGGDDYVEYAIYGGEGELPDLGQLEAAAGEGLVDVTATEVPDDWADRWQDFHQPTLIGESVWVRPSWADPREGGIDIVIDPGRAFGTGAHPTTRLCIEMLIELADAGQGEGELLDLGTGSGVLAIAAAKLGWGPVRACDHEPAAVEAAAANAAENGVDLQLARVNLRELLPHPAPTTVANLTAPLLRSIAARLAVGDRPRQLLCSGILEAEVEGMAEAFAGAGLLERDRRVEAGWGSLRLAADDG